VYYILLFLFSFGLFAEGAGFKPLPNWLFLTIIIVLVLIKIFISIKLKQKRKEKLDGLKTNSVESEKNDETDEKK